MAELKFSSKWTERISHTLALRVFLVSLVLLAIPLLFASLFIYLQESKLRMKELHTSLQLIAASKAELLEERISGDARALGVLELFPNLNNTLLQEIARKEKFSSLSYLVIGTGGHTQCIASTENALIGKTDLFAEEIRDALQGGSYGGFAFVSPENQSKGLYIVKKRYPQTGTAAISLLIASRDAATLIESLSDNRGITLLTKDKHPLVSSDIAGDVLTAQAPINRSSLILQLSVPKATALDAIASHLSRHLVTLLLSILILGGFLAMWFTRLMGKPLQQLIGVMKNIEKGQLKARFRPDRLGFEVNLLGIGLNQMIDALVLQMKKVKQERLAKELLENELYVGREIQQSLLPKEMPSVPHLQVAGGFLSAKEVAGDFYDVLVKKKNLGHELLFAIADASGKGVSACLYSLGLRSILRSYAASSDNLSTILCQTNNLFCLDTQDSGMFVTAWVGMYDTETKKLSYHCSGHPEALLVRAGGTIEPLHTTGIALGVTPLESVAISSVQLEKGDLFLLYTDGIIEAHDPKMNLFGKSRLKTLLQKHHTTSAKDLVAQIIAAVEQFAACTPQYDDLALLAIRVMN